jgi:GNAT superfamily N-acetyltransferase
MAGAREQFEIRLIDNHHADYEPTLHRVLGLDPPPPGGVPAPLVADLLAGACRQDPRTQLLLGAYQGSRLKTGCLLHMLPGAAAMVFTPSRIPTEIDFRATVALLRTAKTVAWQESIALLEALTASESKVLGRALIEAGFNHLTRLIYLRRPGARLDSSGTAGSDLEWVQYTPDQKPLFLDALERTYVQSLDCPELTGLRTAADVLAGHRATGVFDAALWWAAKRHGEPVGLILLNRIPRERTLEVVYMGVARPARGTGVADALLHRAIETVSRKDVKGLTLAVDERNAPARRMYARWGFAEVDLRDAWIAIPPRKQP